MGFCEPDGLPLGSHRHNCSQFRVGGLSTTANLIGWCVRLRIALAKAFTCYTLIDALRFAIPQPTHVFPSFSINTATPTMDDTLTLPTQGRLKWKYNAETKCEQNTNEHIVTIDFSFSATSFRNYRFSFLFAGAHFQFFELHLIEFMYFILSTDYHVQLFIHHVKDASNVFSYVQRLGFDVECRFQNI